MIEPVKPDFMVRDMEDLIKGLTACTEADCDNCPYADIGCSPPLAYDALTVLKWYESNVPRVMTFQEAISTTRSVIVECRAPVDNDADSIVYPLAQYAGKRWNSGTDKPVYAQFTILAQGAGWIDRREDEYGKTWRCWTERPTEKQRKAAAWL